VPKSIPSCREKPAMSHPLFLEIILLILPFGVDQ
jgi:hypothetical protein